MRILSYEFKGESENEINFSKIKFNKLNLIIGNSGAGKTRLLNTIFNSALLVTRKNKFYTGFWDITLEHNSLKYRWIVETGKDDDDGEYKIFKESILSYDGDKETVLVDRSPDSFKFIDEKLPKLSHNESSIALLNNEELIKPIYEALSSIMRRNFSGADLDLLTAFQSLPQHILKNIKKTKSLKDLFKSGLNLSCKLYILSEVFKEKYDKVCADFKATFPFVSEVKLLEGDRFGFHSTGIVPVFALKEKFNNKWIPLNELSSGMKKVLLNMKIL